jgi:hypothetical protein
VGWFFGVVFVIELWTLWQLIKSPFQLIGSLMRSEKPSPWVIVKNVIVAGLAIALVVALVRSPPSRPAPALVSQPTSVIQAQTEASLKPILGTWQADSDLITFLPNGTYVDRAESGQITGPYSLSSSALVMRFPEIEMTAEIVSLERQVLKYRKVKVVEAGGGIEPADNRIYVMVRQDPNQPKSAEPPTAPKRQSSFYTTNSWVPGQPWAPLAKLGSSYTVSVTSAGDGLIQAATITAQGTITALDSSNLPQYVFATFGAAGTILSLKCAGANMATTNPLSSTGNSLIGDSGLGPGITIEPPRDGALTVTCQKKP